ncbi:MAG: AtpZ/AtpI family protein [Candidatus Microsaccharimonas sp.]
MTKSPRLTKQPGQSSDTQPSALSGPMVLFVTALDTTWRAFVPTIGGTFLGIGIDHLFNIAPIGTIVCLILGFSASAALIAQQILSVRKGK